MFQSRIFTCWFFSALVVWGFLFANFNDFAFLGSHWHYPAIMALGAFVAGLTPEGGGAVAFPVLSVFFSVDRVLARDFSLMIQSIGMTSASIFVLTNKPSMEKFVASAIFCAILMTLFAFTLSRLVKNKRPDPSLTEPEEA
jgi:hypothetical protein